MENRSIFLFVVCVATAGAASTGFCGLPIGVDVCKCEGGTIVRPASQASSTINHSVILSKLQGNSKGYPVKDACSCSRSFVAPAIVPVPKCRGAIGSASRSRSSSSSGTVLSHTQTIINGQVVDTSQSHCVANVPADPVSAIIAQNLKNKACGLSEGRLNFGFQVIPYEVKREPNDKIGEEDITQVKGTVIEMQPIQCVASIQTLDEEALNSLPAQEDLILQQNEAFANAANSNTVKELSYCDIGFGVAQNNKNVQFSTIDTQKAAIQAEAVCDNPPPINCADGFVSGGVVFRKVNTNGASIGSNSFNPCAQPPLNSGGQGIHNIVLPRFEYSQEYRSNEHSEESLKYGFQQ